MKTLNIIVPLQKKENYSTIVNQLKNFFKDKEYNYSIIFCVDFDFSNLEFSENITFIKGNINECVNQTLLNSEADYTFIIEFKSNWKIMLAKMIKCFENGNKLVFTSKCTKEKNIFTKVFNFFIELWYAFLNIITFRMLDKSIMSTNKNMQGYSKEVVKIIKTLPENINIFRTCDCFNFIEKKKLYKESSKSQNDKIETLNKEKMSKYTKFSILAISCFIIIMLLLFIVVRPIYMQNQANFKFVLLTILLIMMFLFVMILTIRNNVLSSLNLKK